MDTTAFIQSLEDAERSPRTVAGYGRDLRLFAEWFEQTNHEPLTPNNLTKQDAQHYRQFLQDEHARPNTINRKLAAIAVLARSGRHLRQRVLRKLVSVRYTGLFDDAAPPVVGPEHEVEVPLVILARRARSVTPCGIKEPVQDGVAGEPVGRIAAPLPALHRP